ncbi:MAG: hypothetical protein WAO76_00285 [Georgfuchsia sp.]
MKSCETCLRNINVTHPEDENPACRYCDDDLSLFLPISNQPDEDETDD